ncbi:MAG: hypothetical protein R2771_14885 [Saprospiraceae bacterium]
MILYLFLLSFFNSNIVTSQLSVFNKIDTFKGYNTKLFPLGKGFYIVNGPQFSYDSNRFTLSKFDECANLTSVKEFVSDSITGYYNPDGFAKIVMNPDNDLDFSVTYFYTLLKSEKNSNNPDKLTLIKLNEDGDIIFSKNLETEDKNLLSENANLLTNGNYLYICTSDKNGNTVITSLDANGDVHNSKKILGIDHGSSVVDKEGNIFIFSPDSTYAKIRVNNYSIDSLIWAKKLHDRRFAFVNDPLALTTTTNNIIVTAVIDTTVQIDTTTMVDFYKYQLLSFDYDGNILTQSKGFDYESYDEPMELKFLSGNLDLGVFTMHNNKVGVFDDNISALFEKRYDFQKDSTYDVIDASLEICIDETLVMSGFCYNKTDQGYNLTNPYIFASKTQKGDDYIVEAEKEKEEEICLNDTTLSKKYTMETITVSDTTFLDDDVELLSKTITFEYNVIPIENFYEDKCGKVNMESKEEGKPLCPEEPYKMDVTSYKGATIEWSTGSEDDNKSSITVYEPGEYTATVSLCGTVKVSTFTYNLTDDVEDCFKFYFPNAFTPGDTEDDINKVFKGYYYRDTEDSTYNFALNTYILQVFDRWGEKVFETNDRTRRLGWIIQR